MKERVVLPLNLALVLGSEVAHVNKAERVHKISGSTHITSPVSISFVYKTISIAFGF